MWITWNHLESDFGAQLSFEDKVEIFYEQTVGWQLHIADLVANGGKTYDDPARGTEGYLVPPIRHSGFAVLHICLSYIEIIGSLCSREPLPSMKAFIAGARSIPGLIDLSQVSKRALARLYRRARCGLYHEGRTRRGVGLGQPPDGNAMQYVKADDLFGISPERLPVVLKEHLREYRESLLDRNNSDLRDRFEQRFDAGFAQESLRPSLWKRLLRCLRIG